MENGKTKKSVVQKKYQLLKDVHAVQDEHKILIECQFVVFVLSCVQGILRYLFFEVAETVFVHKKSYYSATVYDSIAVLCIAAFVFSITVVER